MKWVWNEERTKCFDVTGSNSIFLEPWAEENSTLVFLRRNELDDKLGSFPNYDKAREFVNGITGAVWAGNGKQDNEREGIGGYHEIE